MAMSASSVPDARARRRFAAFKRAERALYFSSGYLANLAVLTTFVEAGDTVYSDAFNHASLIDGIRLSRGRAVVFKHNDAADLERALLEIGKTDEGAGQRGLSFVVVESLFSMDGDEAPLSAYAELCRRHGAVLVADAIRDDAAGNRADDGGNLLAIAAAR